jgi:MoxR-like ATPase
MRLNYYGWPPKRQGAKEWPAVRVQTLAPLSDLQEAAAYIPHPDLVSAVNVALVLGRPLLVTGEPGCGKTKLANSIAWQLGLLGPFKFVAKSTSQARDAFYTYDALGRFHASQAEKGADRPAGDGRRANDVLAFVEYAALGSAILLAHDREAVVPFLPKRPANGDGPDGSASASLQHPGPAARSVVVIDEIDKAPRDFPNDLLDEIESMRFRVPELREAPTPELVDRSLRPVVIITSNQERQLPEAFLRRCLYFEIPFPQRRTPTDSRPEGYFVEDIVARRVGEAGSEFVTSPLAKGAIDFFCLLRDLREPLGKKPATAELLDWLEALRQSGANPNEGLTSQPSYGASSLYTLLKGRDDLERGRRLYDEWARQTPPHAS